MRYVASSQEVVVRGRVKPAVPGEVLTLYAVRGKKASKSVRRKVKAGGRFEFRFKVGGRGAPAAGRSSTAASAARRRRSGRATGRSPVVDWQRRRRRARA